MRGFVLSLALAVAACNSPGAISLGERVSVAVIRCAADIFGAVKPASDPPAPSSSGSP